ncbi:hypothetical protein MHBO_003921, partial [Bonamia ostreae]
LLIPLLKDLKDKIFIPSSAQSEELLIKNGLKVGCLNQHPLIDVTLDGVDSIFVEENVVFKGKGGCFLMEKVLIANSKKTILVGTSDKIIKKSDLSKFSISIEILPKCLNSCQNFIKSNFDVQNMKTRQSEKNKIGYVVSDNANFIVDVEFQQTFDKFDQFLKFVENLEMKLNQVPGVFGTGIFLDMVDIFVTGDCK